jgi:hypothetical protein
LIEWQIAHDVACARWCNPLGAKRPAQVTENCRAGLNPVLPAAVLGEIRAAATG